MATNNKRPDSKSRGSSGSDTADSVNLEFGANNTSLEQLQTRGSPCHIVDMNNKPWDNRP